MQVIGLCRFSYPALGGFQVEHETVQERIDYLYADARLAERFQLFETVTLPGLRAQTDPDFTFLVVIGTTLPRKWLQRLEDLISDFPQARLVERPPRRQRRIMRDILNEARDDPSQPCLQFRHDDDDAVAFDFVERLRTAAEDAKGLCDKNPTVAFDWINGYVAEFSETGIASTQVYRPFLGIGFGMYVAGGETTSIMNTGHHKVAQAMPTICFGNDPMWVRTHNGFNDSRQARAKQIKLDPLNAEDTKMYQDRFGIHLDHVKRVFSP